MGGPPAAQGLPARGQARGSSAVPRGDDRGARLHLRQVLDQGLWLEEGSGEDGGGPGLMFRTEEMDINMGPQHPSTHGVLRLVLNLEGEEIVDVRPVIGYLHRGVEKLSEHRTYAMIEPLTDRLDYVAAISENLGYCGAVEKLMGLQVPPRAQSIRVILAELQRIASHLLWLGTHALDLLAVNRIWLGRTQGVGALSREDAVALGTSGPTLRGSGVDYDVRKSQPYSSYDQFDFDVPVGTNGDTYDRYLVRMEEMRQSCRIIQQALDRLPEGEVRAKVPKYIKPPAGEVYHVVESPRGEQGFYIVKIGRA